MIKNVDAEILALAQQPTGMEAAFRLLLGTYKERLYHHIRRMVVEHDDANDVLQNTCIKAYRALERFEGKSSLYTWLYRIATNEALTFMKKKKGQKIVGTETFEQDGTLQAETYLEESEILEKLQAAMEILPEKQRAVFTLRYFEEMTYEQMSEVLETSVGALKASYHHAVKKVERYILDYQA